MKLRHWCKFVFLLSVSQILLSNHLWAKESHFKKMLSKQEIFQEISKEASQDKALPQTGKTQLAKEHKVPAHEISRYEISGYEISFAIDEGQKQLINHKVKFMPGKKVLIFYAPKDSKQAVLMNLLAEPLILNGQEQVKFSFNVEKLSKPFVSRSVQSNKKLIKPDAVKSVALFGSSSMVFKKQDFSKDKNPITMQIGKTGRQSKFSITSFKSVTFPASVMPSDLLSSSKISFVTPSVKLSDKASVAKLRIKPASRAKTNNRAKLSNKLKKSCNVQGFKKRVLRAWLQADMLQSRVSSITCS